MIRVCGDNMYPPFEYYNHEGNATGFNVELIDAIDRCTDIFRESYDIELLPWQIIEGIICRGEKDIIEGISITNKRRENIAFTNSFMEVPHCIYVLSSNTEIYTYKDLENRLILAQYNDPICGLKAEDTLIKDTFFELKLVKDIETGFKMLNDGMGDAIISPEPTADYFIDKTKEELSIRQVTRLYWTDYAIGASKKNKELIEKINKGLKIIQEQGELDRLKKKWFGDRYNAKEETNRRIISTGIVQVDENGKIISFNKEGGNIFRCGGRESIDDERLVDLIAQSFRTMEPVECILSRDDKQYQSTYNCSIFPDDKKKTGTIIIRDAIEESDAYLRRLNEDKMDFAEKFISKFFERINTPFTTVKMFSDLLPESMDRDDFASEFQKYVPQALDEIRKINEMFVKKCGNSEMEKIELLRAVNIAINNAVLEIGSTKVQQVIFEVNIDEGIYVLFNGDEFHDVLKALIYNSVESNSDTVYITASALEGSVKILLKDNGCGMTQDEIARAFEPMYSSKRNHLGMGLSMAYSSVKRNKGDIYIRKGKNEGVSISVIAEGGLRDGEHSNNR